ncbi:MAG TPA: hypothetical protein VG347_01940 [Verrucomicrobiae bacterium]|nr:hypothetical protein [Verrucomicrobiae bacterium]
MFHLEPSITNWRQQMLAADITSASLDELELHLREEIERQMQSGLNGELSFHAAVRIIGRAVSLGTEFQKVERSPGSRLVKLLGLGCAVAAGLFASWMLFVLLTVHEADWSERLLGVLAIVAIMIIWRQSGKWLPAIRHAWLRPLSGALCCLASMGGMKLFITSIVPPCLGRMTGANPPIGLVLVAFIWTWAAVTMLGVLAYKLQITTVKNEVRHV